MNDNTPMPFGIHKGKALANVPGSYLLWLLENDKCQGDLKIYIEDNYDLLKSEK